MKPANSRSRKGKPGEVFDHDLGRHPVPKIEVQNLMEEVVEDGNIITAARFMMDDTDKAAGPDRKTVAEVCEPMLQDAKERERLRQILRKGSYQPGAVRTAYIPKGKNGPEAAGAGTAEATATATQNKTKMRRLCIANMQDRLVQRMILQAVEAHIPEGTWSDSSFAYTKGTGVAQAVERADRIIAEGYRYAICVDLEAFFDNVPHSRLMRKLEEHLQEKPLHNERVVSLVEKFITTTVIDRGTRTINRKGVPQGYPISPWLASKLYLHELDCELERRRLPFVRYADDVTVFCRTKAAAKRVRARITRYLEEEMECKVNAGKTKIVPVDTLALLGLYRKGKVWTIQRGKEREACDSALSSLRCFIETGAAECREAAALRFHSWREQYRHIPNIDDSKIRKLDGWFGRWMERSTWEAAERLKRGLKPTGSKDSD